VQWLIRSSKGDVVALHAVPGCNQQDCPECSRDLSQICERGHHSGIGQDGFYAPYATIDARGAVLVPDGMVILYLCCDYWTQLIFCPGVTPAQAAVATDAINTAYHAIHRRAEVKASETVFLFGLGGLGFNALQVVLAIGARVIVSDVREELLQAARELGVPVRDIVPPGMSPQDFVARESLQIDTVLDFVGKHQTFNDAQNIGTYEPTYVIQQIEC
jgi:propanol-preferring alcohol dehydrogenase